MPELVLTKKGANGHHKFTLTVTETSYSIENNTSVVSFSLKISKVHGGYDYNWGTNNASAYTETVNINGTTYTAHNGKYDGSSTTTYISGTQTITHDADGSKTITCSFSVDDKTGQSYTSGDASASGTLTLTTIPRASSFNASSYSGTLGTAMSITYTSASNSFNHTLTFSLGSTTIGTNNTSGTFSWTPSYNLATNNTSGTTLSGTLTLITYNGTTELGRKTAPCSLTIPNNSTTQPTLSIATSDTKGYLSTYNAYVYTKSILRITPSATYKYNSSIKSISYTLRKNNSSGAILTSGSYSTLSTFTYTTNYVGTIHITTTITDTRNFSKSATTTITVANYSPPNTSQFQCERDSTTESTINCYITGSSTNINNASSNTTTWTLQYKKTSASSWTTANTWTGYTLSKQPQTITGTDVDASYDIKLTAVDQFSTVTKTTIVTSTFTLMNFSNGGKGIAIGKSSETEELFECDLQTKFNKDINILGNVLGNTFTGGTFKSKNMITSWFIGGISATDGSETSSSNTRRTGYIEVDFTKVSSYRLSGTPTSTIRHYVAAYNSSMQFLGRTGGVISGGDIVTSSSFTNGTPQGTGAIKYLRVGLYSGATDSSTTTVQLEEGESATTFYPYQNLNGQEVYSTMETKIGTWIDGYNIYRKVVLFNPSSSSFQTTFNHNISNIKEILPTSSCMYHRTNGQFVPFSMVYAINSTDILAWSIGWQVTTSTIYTWIGSSMRGQMDTSNYGAVAILEYTKTTN